MKAGKSERAVAGRISKTFGLNGELVISLYDAFEYNSEEPVYVDIDGIQAPLYFKSFVRRGRSKAVAVFDDFETEFRASELTGKEFSTAVESQSETTGGETSYMESFTGYAVSFENDSRAGTITGFIDNNLNPLFSVELSGEEVLIPANEDFIVGVNKRKKTIVMSLPEGLIDINV